MALLRDIRPVRNVDAGALLESLFVYAIAAILVIRVTLGATGYPQLGGRGLHIAHMLWGGLLMLVAIVLLLAFLGRSVVRLSAVLGGIGFGLFIDELGKFITSDNDYFFQPTIALIYTIFVILFLVSRAIDEHKGLTGRDALVNTIDLLIEAGRGDMDAVEKQKALALLRRSDANDRLVPELTAMVRSMTVEPDRALGWTARMADTARRMYKRLIRVLRSGRVLITIFALLAVLDLANVVRIALSIPGFSLTRPQLSFVEWADLITSTTFAVLVAIGVVHMRTSRVDGYRWLRRALLISIFFSQIFYFYALQLVAVIGLAISLLLLGALDAMIRTEQAEASS